MDTPPGEIALQLNVGRATVYRDIDALRGAGWDIPPRPMGRRPGGSQSKPDR
jgi:biotin operon repressor